MTARRFFISLICVVLLSPLAAETCLSQSAWQELIRQNPAVVDDPSIDWQQRLILHALTREQAESYYRGASPDELILESGETLSEYLAARLNPPGNLYVPLPGSCELLRVEDLLVDESLSLSVRGKCGIPEGATAVILQVKAESMGGSPCVKLWASDLPEPAEAVFEGSDASFEDLKAITAVVTLCAEDRCRGGELRVRGKDAARVKAEAVGYFRPLSAADGAGTGGGIQFYTEGSNNNFFGTGAGASNGVCDPGTSPSSCYNAFFGGDAGNSNTTGNSNAFFGTAAGASNTEGYQNAFFGTSAGSSNTMGYDNAFFGTGAGINNTTGERNAFFGSFAGLSNTTGYNNAFFGQDAGLSNTTGYNNAFFGRRAGYSNSDGWYNSFFGYQAGRNNTSGSHNVFFGVDTGYANTTGSANAFFGVSAGYNNTTGSSNAFFGYQSGFNTTGSSNAFFGRDSGVYNTTGFDNAFFGRDSGRNNTTGGENAFFGYRAGYFNTTGIENAFFGRDSGFYNTTGAFNAFFGTDAGVNHTTGYRNAFFGHLAGTFNTVESNNTFIGYLSNLDPGSDPGTSPVTNATAIGANAYVSQSNSLVLGSINGVNGASASTQVGIGITAPERLLHLVGSNAVFRMDRSANSAAFMLVRTDSGGGILKNFVIGVNASGANQGEFIINDLGAAVGGGGQRRLTINNDGDVIINGDLITNAGALSFPDYVFAKNYALMPLEELSEYVETQKHLPEIPSAGEIQKQGEINMTELQLKLLKKIEELTLYTIKQQARIEQLTEQNRQAFDQNNELRSRLEALENEGGSKH